MGAKPQQLCVNCKHYKKQYDYSRCFRKAQLRHSKPNPVNGRVSTYTDDVLMCGDERRWNGPHCGPNAQFYTEKRWRQRLIAWTGI